jgi:hypothetical protein
MHLRALLVFVAASASTAASANEPPAASPPQFPASPPQSPVAPPQPTQSTLADKSAVMTGEWVTSGRSPAPVFGMDLLLGQQTGIRPSLALYSTERSSFVVEGYYGGLFTKFGAAETAGAGVRWVTTRGGLDSVTLGPGVDVLFHLNRGKAVILAPTVDVAWRRNFGDRAAFVLGLNAGVGVGLSGGRWNDRDDPVAGRATPLISFYTGFRY